MDIVLGVSMTPTTVRMVLVEGDRADGATVDHDVFDIAAADSSANSSASEQVISAILGTQQSALAGGHRLTATGVTWTDHDDAAALRDALADHGIEDVTLISELHAAGALAQAAGRAVGYDKTALMLVDRDSATLSVVETGDGSIVKVMTRSLHTDDAMAVLTDMVAGLEATHVRPDGMFVLGAGVDVASVKEHLEHLVSVPVSAPDDAEMALTRGAAIAAANTPRFEASTVGLAYSQDPELDPAFAATQLSPAGGDGAAIADAADPHTRRPFLLVGSALTSVFVVGVVALVISLAVSIRPTVDQRPNPGENVVVPSTSAPVPPHPQPAQQAQQVQPPPVQPPPETIPAPVPVVQEQPQAPRRTVVAVPQAPPPAPVPAAPAPEPAAVPPPPAAAPPVDVPPPAPAYVPPPAPVYVPPIVGFPFPHPYRPPWRQRQAPWQPPVDQPPWQQQPQQPPWQQQQPPWQQQPSGPIGPFCGPRTICLP